MIEPSSFRSSKSTADALEDVTIRERQIQMHLLHSPEYLRKADQELKRQVTVLYLAIALLLLFQGFFAWRTVGQIPLGVLLLTIVTSSLAVVNCVLLIRTKNWLRRINEAWLKPEERTALESLRQRRNEILAADSANPSAGK